MENETPFSGRLTVNEVAEDDSKRPYGCIAVDNIYNILHYSDPISYLLSPAVDASASALLELPNLPTEGAFMRQHR